MKLFALLTFVFVPLLVGCFGEESSRLQEIDYSPASSVQIKRAETDWKRWRGPNGNGIAPANQNPVVDWDSKTNVVWKTRVPGSGHASPTIVGDRIFLATEDEGTQSVVCFNRDDGSMLWMKECSRGGLRRIHRNNTHASSTISSDGERLFALFESHGKAKLYSFDLNGKKLWSRECCRFDPHYPFGFGASPLLHGDLVYVAAESKKGFLVAYNRKSGDEVWRVNRDWTTNYSSPIVTRIDGREMLLLSGGKKVIAYTPDTGRKIWEAPARWRVTCGTMVWDGNMVFASGGFPDSQTLGINGSNGEVVWSNKVKCYEQSLLAYDGYVYAISDRSVAYCWRARDGKEMWKTRLGHGGSVSASPILANGHIYASVEAGTTFVFQAKPEKFELVSTNVLGTRAFASPTIIDSLIYLRVGDGDGREWLYCIGRR